MKYLIHIKRTAQKDIARLHPRVRVAVQAGIDALADDPRPRGSIAMKGEYAGCRRARVGAYRIIYTVDDAERLVTIAAVGPRESIYD